MSLSFFWDDRLDLVARDLGLSAHWRKLAALMARPGALSLRALARDASCSITDLLAFDLALKLHLRGNTILGLDPFRSWRFNYGAPRDPGENSIRSLGSARFTCAIVAERLGSKSRHYFNWWASLAGLEPGVNPGPVMASLGGGLIMAVVHQAGCSLRELLAFISAMLVCRFGAAWLELDPHRSIRSGRAFASGYDPELCFAHEPHSLRPGHMLTAYLPGFGAVA